MFRFYWNGNRDDTQTHKEVVRTDGGWWFSEETSEERLVYEVVERKEISPSHFLELLKPLPQDFLQLPCWKQEAVVWKVHRKEAQGELRSHSGLLVLEWNSQLGPEPLAVEPQPLAVEPQPLPHYQPLPHWVQQELGHLDNIIQKGMKHMGYLPILHQEEKKPSPLLEKLPEKVVQKKPSYVHRATLKEPSVQHAQQLSEQSQKQGPSSFQGKGLRMGQLCSPSFVPDQQSSRVLHYRPSKHQKQNLQVNYNQCQIVQM